MLSLSLSLSLREGATTESKEMMSIIMSDFLLLSLGGGGGGVTKKGAWTKCVYQEKKEK